MSLNSQAVLDKFKLVGYNLPLQSVTADGIDVLPAPSVVAIACWRAVLIWQMTSAEMAAWGVAGQTVCHNIVLDEDGTPATIGDLRHMGATMRYGWDNSESTHSALFEKPWPEPHTNFAMGNGGRYWAEIGGLLQASDRVRGITLHNQRDSAEPNGHHVTVIVWQRQVDDVINISNPEPAKPAHGYALVKLADLDEMLSSIDTQINALRAMRQEVASWRKP